AGVWFRSSGDAAHAHAQRFLQSVGRLRESVTRHSRSRFSMSACGGLRRSLSSGRAFARTRWANPRVPPLMEGPHADKAFFPIPDVIRLPSPDNCAALAVKVTSRD